MPKNKILYKIICAIGMASLFVLVHSASTASPLNGLIGYWTLDNQDFNGVTFFERLTNLGHASSTGATGVTTVIGKIKQAALFDATIDVLSANNSSAYKQNSFTVAFWFKSNVISDTQVIQDIRQNHAVVKGYVFYLASSKINFGVTVNGTTWGTSLANNNTLKSGTWYHVVGTFTSGASRLYINGIKQNATASTAGSVSYDTYPLRFGGGNSTYPLAGSIDEMRIYNRVLSAAEVSQLYNSARTLQIR